MQALDYGVPESNILGIRYGFKGFYDKVNRCAYKPSTPTWLLSGEILEVEWQGGRGGGSLDVSRIQRKNAAGRCQASFVKQPDATWNRESADPIKDKTKVTPKKKRPECINHFDDEGRFHQAGGAGGITWSWEINAGESLHSEFKPSINATTAPVPKEKESKTRVLEPTSAG